MAYWSNTKSANHHCEDVVSLSYNIQKQLMKKLTKKQNIIKRKMNSTEIGINARILRSSHLLFKTTPPPVRQQSVLRSHRTLHFIFMICQNSHWKQSILRICSLQARMKDGDVWSDDVHHFEDACRKINHTVQGQRTQL